MSRLEYAVAKQDPVVRVMVGGDDGVVQVTPENFQSEIIEKSQSMPVLLLFWADQVPPSAQARVQLEALMPAYSGKAVLGLVDVSQDQMIAQQLRVQGLPSVRVVHQGQLVDQLDGPQGDAVYQELLDRLTLSSSDMLRAQLDQLLAADQYDQALSLLQQAVNEEPNNQAFRVELADVLVRAGQLDDARTVLAGIPEETEGVGRPRMRLEFVEEAQGLADLATLESQLAANEDDLDVRYGLCVHHAVNGDFESALEFALGILQRDRQYRDDIGRTTMIRIFDVLGKGSSVATQYRRRMFNFMH